MEPALSFFQINPASSILKVFLEHTFSRRRDSFARIITGPDTCASITVYDDEVILSNNTGCEKFSEKVCSALEKIKLTEDDTNFQEIEEYFKQLLKIRFKETCEIRSALIDLQESEILKENPEKFFIKKLIETSKNIQSLMVALLDDEPQTNKLENKDLENKLKSAREVFFSICAELFIIMETNVDDKLIEPYLKHCMKSLTGIKSIKVDGNFEKTLNSEIKKAQEKCKSSQDAAANKAKRNLLTLEHLLSVYKSSNQDNRKTLSQQILDYRIRAQTKIVDDKLGDLQSEFQGGIYRIKKALGKVITELKTLAKKSTSLSHLKWWFQKSEPKPHAEMDVLQRIYEKTDGFKVIKHKVYIGINKLCCADCYNVVLQLVERFPKLFESPPVRGTHEKPYSESWKPPQFFYDLELKPYQKLKQTQAIQEEAPDSPSNAGDCGFSFHEDEIYSTAQTNPNKEDDSFRIEIVKKIATEILRSLEHDTKDVDNDYLAKILITEEYADFLSLSSGDDLEILVTLNQILRTFYGDYENITFKNEQSIIIKQTNYLKKQLKERLEKKKNSEMKNH